MLSKIKRRISTEMGKINSLNPEAKNLLYSFLFISAALPFITTFLQAYLWRESQSLTRVALFNFTRFSFLPVGFYLNGKLIGKIKLSILYFLGSLSYVVASSFIILLPNVTIASIIFGGIISGIGSALFWANRNLLLPIIIPKKERIYYLGLVKSFVITIDLIVPLFLGWFIVLGERTNTYSISFAYKIIPLIIFILIVQSGRFALKIETQVSRLKHIIYTQATSKWNLIRLVYSLRGFFEGVMRFLPSILVLTLIGDEGALGTVKAIAALAGAGITYFVGRKAKEEHRIKIYLFGALLFLFGSIFLGLTYSFVGTTIFIVGNIAGKAIKRLVLYSLAINEMDTETKKDHNKLYPLIFDVELFLNIGRTTGIMMLLFLAKFTSSEFATRTMPIILSIAMFIVLIPTIKLSKSQARSLQK